VRAGGRLIPGAERGRGMDVLDCSLSIGNNSNTETERIMQSTGETATPHTFRSPLTTLPSNFSLAQCKLRPAGIGIEAPDCCNIYLKADAREIWA